VPDLNPALAVALVLAGVACVTDLHKRRVPNVLTFGAMGLGLLMHLPGGTLLSGLVGLALAFATTYPAWLLGGAIRAGDAKLLMALGAILGWRASLELVFLTYLLAIPFTVVAITVQGRWKSFFKVLRAGLRKDPDGPKPAQLPFVPVILVALLVRSFAPIGSLWPW
jgi:prepilin peptidase CpaA